MTHKRTQCSNESETASDLLSASAFGASDDSCGSRRLVNLRIAVLAGCLQISWPCVAQPSPSPVAEPSPKSQLTAQSAGNNGIDPKVRALVGFDLPGQLHNNSELGVKAVVFSHDDAIGKPPSADDRHRLLYRVCNLNGDLEKQGEPRLYFQWDAAGLLTTPTHELRVGMCSTLTTDLTWRTSNVSTDIKYLRKPVALRVLETHVMNSEPPWFKPNKYWEYATTLRKEHARLKKGSDGQQLEPLADVAQISMVRKGPNEPAAYQGMRWEPGSVFYLALPDFTAKQREDYLRSLAQNAREGYTFRIMPGTEAAAEFTGDDAGLVRQALVGRDVLRIQRDPKREEAGQLNTVRAEIPTPTVEVVSLTAVARSIKDGAAMYMLKYVAAGH